MNLINKLLRKEEIARGDGSVYLHRWTLFRSSPNGLFSKIGLGDMRIYVHRFTDSDHTKCKHDHPNKLTSFIFWNGYSEEYWDTKEKCTKVQVYKAPCLRTFPASHAHRVTLLDGKHAWSIVWMRPKERPWGFWMTHDAESNVLPKRKWVHWKEYEDKYGGNGGCE